MKWLDVIQAAQLLKINARSVRNRALKGTYVYQYVDGHGKGRGGRTMKILLSSLPDDAIARDRKSVV